MSRENVGGILKIKNNKPFFFSPKCGRWIRKPKKIKTVALLQPVAKCIYGIHKFLNLIVLVVLSPLSLKAQSFSFDNLLYLILHMGVTHWECVTYVWPITTSTATNFSIKFL